MLKVLSRYGSTSISMNFRFEDAETQPDDIEDRFSQLVNMIWDQYDQSGEGEIDRNEAQRLFREFLC